MLWAFRNTPLYDRLEKLNRLDKTEPPPFGTNIIPARMSGEELRDGYVWLHAALYNPESFFQRLDALFRDPEFEVGFARQKDYWRHHRLMLFWREFVNAVQAAGLFLRMMALIQEAELRREYRRRVRGLLRNKRRPGLVLNYLMHCIMQYHAWSLARKMADGKMPVVNTY